MNHDISESDDCGFDEETGKTITAEACPNCGGALHVDGGEIACLTCEGVLNEYARTGRVSDRATDEGGSRAEVA